MLLNEKYNTYESFGIIPLNKKNNKWYVFVIQHKAGHWGFPKGHKLNDSEDSKVAAQRELKEETGLHVSTYLSETPLEKNYECIINEIHTFKKVIYFIALVDGKPNLCPIEVKQACWVELDKAENHLTFDASKKLIAQIKKILKH